ncbi:hypothetical protein MLD38_034154 [Melastoma candidum]|uniref:Uncharacterized protein n=1 Tax=Melastoma candidum TaxID=119954 RepID=A0ACB9MCV3_9MYRT|nr:hypothetical protein MLD38_034154 [Melastoma candidum]
MGKTARSTYKSAVKADPLCNEAYECLIGNHMLTHEEDPFHAMSTLVHVAAVTELGHSNELYVMACNLLKDYPQK